MEIIIHLTEEETELAEQYAKNHAMSLEEACKEALLERIEDEYDAAIAEEAYRDYVKDGRKSRPVQQLLKEIEDIRESLIASLESNSDSKNRKKE